MTDTRTIDQRIIEKADADLAMHIERIFKPVINEFCIGYTLHAVVTAEISGEERAKYVEVKVEASHAIQGAKKAIIDHLTPKWREKAREDFIKKVDDLAEQVEELRHSVNA